MKGEHLLKKKQKAKKYEADPPKDVGSPKRNKASSNKLKLVKIDLDSDEDNLDLVADTSKHSKTIVSRESDSYFTEDVEEISQKTLSSNRRRGKKLHLEKNCDENVKTSLKISKINIDDSTDIEDSDKNNQDKNTSKCEDLNVISKSSVKKLRRKKKRSFDQDPKNYDTDTDFENENISNSDSTPQVKKLKKEKLLKSKNKSVKLRERSKLRNKRESLESTKADENMDSKSSNLKSTDKNITSESVDKIIEDVVQESVLDDEAIVALSNLNIIINWDLPTSHKLDSGSHNLSRMKPKIEKALQKEGLVWKTKVKYTEEECEIIMKNWEEFSDLYGFKDPKVFFQSNQYVKACRYTERLKFKQYLAKGLPDRPLYSVYHKFTQLYGYSLKGRWNYKEDMILHSINQGQFKETLLKKHILLCKALDRNWMSVYRRIKQMEKSKDLQEKIKPINWTMNLMVDLLENLLEETNSSSVEDLKNMDIPSDVWNSVGAKMEIDDRRIKRYWFETFYPQLFATRPIYRNDFKKELIEWLYKLPFDKWTDLSWEKISKKFYDVGKLFIYVRFRRMVQTNVPRDKWSNFRECIDDLYHNYRPLLKLDPKSNYVLRRIRYHPETHTLEEAEEPTEENADLKENSVESEIDDSFTDLKMYKIKKHDESSNTEEMSMLTDISQTQKKSRKKKHRNVKDCLNKEQNQNTVIDDHSDIKNYSCEDETKNVDLETHDTSIKTSFENRITNDNDSCNREIFDKNTSKNRIMEKNRNLEEISMVEEGIVLQKQKTIMSKKLDKSKHKNLDVSREKKALREEREVKCYNPSEETSTTKPHVMEDINVESDEIFGNETRLTLNNSFKTEDGDKSFSYAELNHNTEEIEQTKIKKKDLKSSKEKGGKKSSDLGSDTDQEQMSSSYKRKKSQINNVWEDNKKSTLEKVEERNLDTASKFQNNRIEGISNKEYDSFLKSKYISATSTIIQPNKKKFKFIDEYQEYLNKSVVKNQDATPTSSKHSKKRKNL